ncbi:hypothetical protein HYS93_04100 [Candidatus Daviesbacteria bacterium]|nr:hypothetical protein [Candidatus Daviesbacteria bacterium]
MQAVTELEVNPDSIGRLTDRIVGKLNQEGPNIQSEVDPETGKIKVGPIARINRFEIGAFQDYEKRLEGEPAETENQTGRETVARIAPILHRELVEHDFFLSASSTAIAPHILTESGGMFSSVRGQLYLQDSFKYLIGTNPDGSKLYHPPTEAIGKMATSKGMPQKVSEAIVYATASWFAKTVESEITTEAQETDDKFVSEQKPLLEADIASLKDQQIPEQQQAVTQAREGQTNSEQSERSSQQEYQTFQESSDQVDKFIRQHTDHLSADDRQKIKERLKEQLGPALQALKEQGFLLSKRVVVDPTALDSIANILNSCLTEHETEEVKQAAEKIGYLSTAEILQKAASERVAGLLNSSEQSTGQIFNQARSAISNTAIFDFSFLNEQQILFNKLLMKDPTAARDFALGLLRQSLVLHSLTEGIDPSSRPSYHKNELTDALDKNFREALRSGEPMVKSFQSYNQARQAASTARYNTHTEEDRLSGLESSLQQKEAQLTSLDSEKESRVKALRDKIWQQVQERLHGTKTARFFKDNPWSGKLEGYLKSELLSEVMEAVFAGLPHCLPQQERERAADHVVRMSLIQRPGSRDYQVAQLTQLKDFLPELVGAMLPHDHPTPELGAEFIAKMLRQYTKSDDVRAMSGIYVKPEQTQVALRFSSQVDQLVTAILRGGQISLLPEEAPRPKLEEVRQLNMSGQQDQASALYQEPINMLKKFLTWKGLPQYFLASNFVLTNPTTPLTEQHYESTISERDFNADPKRAVNNLLYFDEPRFKEVYLIENPQPTRS